MPDRPTRVAMIELVTSIIDREIDHDEDTPRIATAIIDRLTAMEAFDAPEWRDIKDAPRDGSRIWGHFPFDSSQHVIHWEHNIYDGGFNWTLDDGESAVQNFDPPTHWLPLPAPPERKETP